MIHIIVFEIHFYIILQDFAIKIIKKLTFVFILNYGTRKIYNESIEKYLIAFKFQFKSYLFNERKKIRNIDINSFVQSGRINCERIFFSIRTTNFEM